MVHILEGKIVNPIPAVVPISYDKMRMMPMIAPQERVSAKD